MPGKTDLSELNCSLARTLEIVGDWWTLLIIRDAFLGVRRFGDFQKSLGIAKNILATRLERLCEDDILERGGSEMRPLYRLTDKGRGLVPAMVALMQWGRQMGIWRQAARHRDRSARASACTGEAARPRRRCGRSGGTVFPGTGRYGTHACILRRVVTSRAGIASLGTRPSRLLLCQNEPSFTARTPPSGG
jgi:DNA-binding HxlR family transcriptional regulator